MTDKTLLKTALLDEDRLHAVRRTGLLDTPPDEVFDRLTRLVCRLLGVPAALISLVEGDRQFFKSAVGLPQPWLLRRETSLLHSFCQHVVAAGAPVLVQDAARHPILSDNLAIPDLGVVAYLGMPLTTPEGHSIGAICGIATEPRSWTADEAAALRDLADVTTTEVTLHRLAFEMRQRVAGEASAQAATEARARRLEALRHLADGVAHDLADVMQAVQSGVRLATERLGRDNEAAEAVLALVGDIARRGGALTARLLAFTPRRELRPERTDIATLLRPLACALANTRSGPLRIEVDTDPELPSVLTDPEELKAILLGLVAAARGAMPEGGTLTLRAAPDVVAEGTSHRIQLRHGRYVRLSVSDTGTGLGGRPADTGKSASRRDWLGTDVEPELALASDFAEQVGGGLARETQAGIGTTVALWLPAAETIVANDAGLPER